MSDMTTIPEGFADLLDVKTAMLATNGKDGRPQVTAIAFLGENDLIKISLNPSRQKAKNLLRDPKATLFILDPANEYRTLEIRGEVSIVEDPGFAEGLRIGATKYGGMDFRAYDAPNDVRVLAILTPTRVVPTQIG